MNKELTTTSRGTDLVDWSNGDPFERLATALSQTGTPLKFSKGRWFSGFGKDEESADGRVLAADMPGLMLGWRKWENRKIVNAAIGFVADNFRPPQRNDLGDLDESLWERDANGAPRDPWSFGFYL